VRERRRWDLDWLRVIGMLLVFLIHAGEPFNPWDTWHIQNRERSKWLGEIVAFLAPWIMPLFMLLAGTGAWFMLERRPWRAYLRDRVVRIVVPLMFGILVLVPPQIYLQRRQRGQFQGSFVEFFPHFFEGLYPTGNFGWLHLWFLGLLAAFALLALPLFLALRSPGGRRWSARLTAFCARPGAILSLALPLILFRLTAIAVAPGRVTLLDWSNRTILFPLFIYGFLIAGNPKLTQSITRQWRSTLVVAVAFSVALGVWVWPGDIPGRVPPPMSVPHVLFWSCYTLGAWAWVLVILAIGHRFLDVPGTMLARMRELVGAFYMLHQTVIVLIAFHVVQWPLPTAVKFLLVGALSFIVTAAGCELIARWRVSRVAFGLKPTRDASAR
jgi:glucan biosynthesis protein C